MITHVFFDFFGTLVDYDPSILPAHRSAPHEFALRHGIDMPRTASEALWSRAWSEVEAAAVASGRECSMIEIARRYAALLGLPAGPRDGTGPFGCTGPSGCTGLADDTALALLVEEYLDAWTLTISAREGSVESLRSLSAHCEVSVVSNTHDPALVPRLAEQFGFTPFLTSVYTSIDIGWRKPHREIFTEVLRRSGARAEESIFVGDNWEADVEGPQSAGMTALYVGAAELGRPAFTLADVAARVERETLR